MASGERLKVDMGKTTRNKVMKRICNTVDAAEMATIAERLHFQEEGRAWYVYRIPYLGEKDCADFVRYGMQPYLPTYEDKVRMRGGRTLVVRRPKILNYLFVLATAEQVAALLRESGTCPLRERQQADAGIRAFEQAQKAHAMCQELSQKLSECHKQLALTDDEKKAAALRATISQQCGAYRRLLLSMEQPLPGHRYLVIPHEQMHRLMVVVQGYEREVQFEVTDEAMLHKGDKVRVIAGRFAGLQGFLSTSQGKPGGEVLVSLSERVATDESGHQTCCPVLAVRTLHIKAEELKIVAFAPDSPHFFNRIAAVERVFVAALRQRKDTGGITPEQRAKIEAFVQQCDELQNLSRVNRVKLHICFYVAYSLLGLPAQANGHLQLARDPKQGVATAKIAKALPPSASRYIDRWTEAVAQS